MCYMLSGNSIIKTKKKRVYKLGLWSNFTSEYSNSFLKLWDCKQFKLNCIEIFCAI